MAHYIAINIGPIASTLSMARKPREFWQASYLFSYLMKCLIKSISGRENLKLISPVVADEEIGVGLYPDRAFFKSEKPVVIGSLIDEGLDNFAHSVGDCRDDSQRICWENLVRDYFNVMAVSVEADSEKEAVSRLNEKLNFLELSEKAPASGSSEQILSLLQKKFDSPLFKIAFGNKRFEIETLEGIAEYELKKWPSTKRKSYHDYICIVQADGDNMGKIVSNLPDGELSEISRVLSEFGKKACDAIEKFGGMPVYAGGDDLLFIAPVWGGDMQPQSIFSLLARLDKAYEAVSGKVNRLALKDEDGKAISTSMSYGLSVTYCKYPLYEAWKIAGEQLFGRAKKNWKNKNSIAWKLQKHSGTVYEGDFSKTDTRLCEAFYAMIHLFVSDNIVSAVSHKIRSNENLVSLFETLPADLLKIRLNAFFEKVVDVEDKDTVSVEYLRRVYELMLQLYETLPQKNNRDRSRTFTSELVSCVYGMLRMAKFINGEEDK